MTAAVAISRRRGAEKVMPWLQSYGVYLAIVVLLLGNLIFTPAFFATGNLRTQLIQVVPVLLVALGMAIVIGTGGIDLSVGAVMALAAAVIPLYIGYGPVVAVGFALAAGLLVGAANGAMVALVGVQAIVATLSLMVAGRGIALLVSGEKLTSIEDPGLLRLGQGSIAGIPVPVLIAAVLAVGVFVLVNTTTFGKQLAAVGGNRTAARLAGLPVRRVLFTVYVVSAVLAAVAGVISTARLGASVPSTLGNLIELSAITAVVIGGTPLTGGRVRVLGTIAGALLLQLITATLVMHDVPDAYAQLTQAAIILIAVFLQRGRAR
ncbi:ABC transporter permease [Tsukamurella spumae]|uniref:ABC transporter permease n=1 Tax=Tsukamurella spumae TaxID=44753 RepID=A0A846X0Y1_9ACTN|nr:ABC transporter permease [Tsukamurella spumae]NKY19148.1 ABC transporter permease [Tsukamurella spumae]